jgi:hypothetical protein
MLEVVDLCPKVFFQKVHNSKSIPLTAGLVVRIWCFLPPQLGFGSPSGKFDLPPPPSLTFCCDYCSSYFLSSHPTVSIQGKKMRNVSIQIHTHLPTLLTVFYLFLVI